LERHIFGLAGEKDDLIEIPEDFAEMFQPFASPRDDYGSLPRIEKEICLHTRDHGQRLIDLHGASLPTGERSVLATIRSEISLC
jgi:hypothetical protein